MALVRSRFEALGTYVEMVLAGRPGALGTAVRLLRAELTALDLACSRFRVDSELVRANAAAGRPVAITPLLAEAVAVALRAAEQTGGDVDPTLADALAAAGYDGDFAGLPADGAPVVPRPPRRGGWQDVALDQAAGILEVPAGVGLDLGATAKAFGADRSAALIAAATGAGVLVNLGGDIAVAGPVPAGGWPVRVTDRPVHADDGASGQVVHIHGGGLATSSTVVRRWRRGGVTYHHILDPRSGLPAEPVWRTVTVNAASCVDANTASTAAIVRGRSAVAWLTDLGLPSRLVGASGQPHQVAGWPEDHTPPAAGPAVPGLAAPGPAGLGPAAFGPAALGPASAGPATLSPASAGPAGLGLASAGPAPRGPVSAGPAGLGPATSGPAGLGSAGLGSGGPGSVSAGPATLSPVSAGPAGLDSAAQGAAGLGLAGPGAAGSGLAAGGRSGGVAARGLVGAGVRGGAR